MQGACDGQLGGHWIKWAWCNSQEEEFKPSTVISHHDFLAGVIRLEVRAALGLESACKIANFSARELPRFVSSPARDPRAPQNLAPVGNLETELRHRLGDSLLLRRGIEKKLLEGVQA